MAKYRKKPVVIEAIQWDGNLETLSIFPKEDIENVKLRDGYLYIQTLEGEMKANVGDYIIRGVKGEYYPCKPDIFEATYEIVEGSPDTSSPNSQEEYKANIRAAIADYMYSEGCMCCEGEDHKDHAEKIAKLLDVPKYEDGSGYNFSQFRSN